MKALSLKQPFAELVVSGRKTVELRKWNTKFRGTFYIHASKIPDRRAMSKFGFKDLPLGCIVGCATLVDVLVYDDTSFAEDRDKHLAGSSFGKFGFVLKDCKRLEKKYVKGKLGFWEV